MQLKEGVRFSFVITKDGSDFLGQKGETKEATVRWSPDAGRLYVAYVGEHGSEWCWDDQFSDRLRLGECRISEWLGAHD